MFRKLFASKTIRANPSLAAALGLAIATLALTGGVGAAFAQDGEADAADLARGEQLYALCTKCHMADGSGNREVLAPAIAGMPSWYVEMQLKNFKNGIRGLHAQDTGGLRMYPMSQWLRSEADQKAVAAYVAAMPPVELDDKVEDGNASMGAGYYAVCSGCHGAQGEGNKGMGAPPLVGQSDWYLLSSIQKYKNGVRGSGAGDPYGAAMQAMVGTLPDEAAIVDLIAHIETLEN